MNRHIVMHAPHSGPHELLHGSLHGEFQRPENAHGLVLVACPHDLPAADLVDRLLACPLAVFSMALLGEGELRFPDAAHNVPRLTRRLLDVLDLVRRDGDMAELPLAILAVDEAVPAAIRAAARRDRQIAALACHGGLVDLAGREALELLAAPLLASSMADDDDARQAFARATPYLAVPHQSCIGDGNALPVEILADWLCRRLKRKTDEIGA